MFSGMLTTTVITSFVVAIVLNVREGGQGNMGGAGGGMAGGAGGFGAGMVASHLHHEATSDNATTDTIATSLPEALNL